jgi:formamidopyrimidine-DNA glycosylase
MPELPEVETTRRGIAHHLTGARITNITVRDARLRWHVAEDLPAAAEGRLIEGVGRRAKYVLIHVSDNRHLLLHLGMSGSVRMAPATDDLLAHDHILINLGTGAQLRFNDPRRFGSLHLVQGDPESHPLLAGLGPEPLGQAFHGDYLYELSRNRRVSIKAFIMDARVVVGVGNIYAAEALHRAGIHPGRPARRVARARYNRLVAAIKAVLGEAIEVGGTTLRDFTASDGRPGYFRQSLAVYGRAGSPCPRCGRSLRTRVIGQRTTVFCVGCQT